MFFNGDLGFGDKDTTVVDSRNCVSKLNVYKSKNVLPSNFFLALDD